MPQGPEREPEPREGRGEGRRGNQLGIWFFKAFLKLFGLRGSYGLLYLVSLHYALFDRRLVASTLPYIRRRFPGCGLLEERLHVYRLFVSQGKQLIDRYAAVSGSAVFEVLFRGGDEVLSLIRNSGRGALLLTSHQGNWQVALTALEKLGKPVHLVMVPDRNPGMQRALYPDGEAGKLRIISPERYLGGVVEILKVLRRGEVVSMMGDRGYGASAVEVAFLGDRAWFPYSAFSLAAAAQCPLVVMETTKISSYSYAVDMSNVLYPRYQGRRDRAGQLQPWVQEFVNQMERFVQANPYQCFLFRDVWQREDDDIPG
jgi:predicted LPLAT superfamily acyltransferase